LLPRAIFDNGSKLITRLKPNCSSAFIK
jgi:hypothetical protein